MRTGVTVILSWAVAAITVACDHVPPDAPVAVMENGKMVEIRNCPPVNAAYRVECHKLTCEQALFARGLIPGNAKIVGSESQYNFTDSPNQTRHKIKYPTGSTFGYAVCEMDGPKVISTSELKDGEGKW